jgi:hypothetical protein
VNILKRAEQAGLGMIYRRDASGDMALSECAEVSVDKLEKLLAPTAWLMIDRATQKMKVQLTTPTRDDKVSHEVIELLVDDDRILKWLGTM